MGAWGIKALESDEGLDVIDILENEYIPEHSIVNLEEIIQLMRDEVMLGKDLTEVDFLGQNSELLLNYDTEDEVSEIELKDILNKSLEKINNMLEKAEKNKPQLMELLKEKII